ncbi:LAFE_0F15456g1_1 [Lachancea fermentati]|uniref:E3 SUMO-protein transferase SIZ2 n=1 Tax=Lachancea fermentati TaxID=4955 RepID=A0A1G4MGG4_LACFM|nr:LAFE_0F15456g1_1 [Lachancea fermentati]
MAVSSGGLHQEIEDCIQEMSRLKVAELKSVSRSIGLSLSGRKADLQDRLRAYLRNSCRVGYIDPWRPKAVSVLIGKARQSEPLPTYESIWQSLKTGAYRHPVATGHQPPSSLPTNPLVVKIPSVPTQSRATLQFSESPFYRLKRMVNGSPRIAVKNNGRGVCSYKFVLNQDEMGILQKGPQFRLYLFSGVLNPLEAQSDAPIQFPHPNEIRFNETQVKDNVRGLKNKLGTAKPADLTPYLKPVGGENHLQLIYAFTKDDYLIYCYLVEVISPEKLLEEVLRHPKIVTPATLQYLKETLNEDEDDDLVTTSTVMTLKCPISYCRMKYPAKSVHCRHLQCFDALWFIQAQQQIPTWQCPVCQKKIKIQDLAICEFVDNIIRNCDDEVEQVEISSDGSWVAKAEEETPAPAQHSSHQVKKEGSESLQDGALNDVDSEEEVVGSRRNRAQPEPMVISLDSDDESESPSDQHPPQPANNISQTPSTTEESKLNGRGPRLPPVYQINPQLPREHDSLSNIINAYMDTQPGPHHRTLDPRSNGTTPIGAPMGSPSETSSHNSAAFVQRHHQVPNVLGKTPLNNNDQREQNEIQGSPSPSNAHTNGPPAMGTFGEMNIPLLNAPRNRSGFEQNGNGNDGMNSVSYQTEKSSNRNINSGTQENRLPSLSDTLSSNPLGSSSLLGIGGNADTLRLHDPQPAGSLQTNLGPGTDIDTVTNGAQMGNDSTSSEDLPLASLNGNLNGYAFAAGVSNGASNTQIEPTANNANMQRSANGQLPLPPVSVATAERPPLPPIPAAITGRANGSVINAPTDIPVNIPSAVATTRNKKPIVSPFIPRKPYMNILPQKRHISNGQPKNNALQASPGIGDNVKDTSLQSSTNLAGSPPLLSSSRANEQDFIDLTSDD